jgi:hypothetical protein
MVLTDQFHPPLSTYSIGTVKTMYHENILVLEKSFHYCLDKRGSGFQACLGTMQSGKMPLVGRWVVRASRHKRCRSMKKRDITKFVSNFVFHELFFI